ncbi:phage/plasmid replication protein, II/X family [Acinetobacter sp. WCHA55]|uniref:phage/plasmid replication protein, II/X family n=1 Tax=Acinetobacter sp. WCHA55 TaxID=2004646 RepID=UPI002AFEDA62|nr:phage/plasmid replication protein, II/X family [Acinetobacter sp. WCHA55]
MQNLNLNLATNEEKPKLNLYAIDYLKVELQLTNNPSELSEKVVVPFIKFDGEYQQQQESYGQKWIIGSHGNQLKIKSKNENTVFIEGNFFKWLYGHNVTGSTDLIKLVTDTVNELLVGNLKGLQPTAEELENLKQGYFKIYRIDLNKAILFDDKKQAQLYLAKIKEHGTYPRRKKETHGNGTYFGLKSTRTTLLYYHKGTEVSTHKKQHKRITAELQAYADCMVRCEVRLYSQHLRDNNLNYGHVWDDDLVVKTVDEQHALLHLPPQIAEKDLPPKYVRFLATYKQGALPIAYTASTTVRFKRDLANKYGILV